MTLEAWLRAVVETPGLTYAEPCYARELEWLLLDGLNALQDEAGEALYLRLSTKPIDQGPFDPRVHTARPYVAFSRPLWRLQDIYVALRAFDPKGTEWAEITRT